MTTLRKFLLEHLVRRRPQKAFQISSQLLGITSITLRLSAESPLFGGEEASSINLPMDQVITPFVLSNGHWQLEELEFFRTHLPSGPCILVDVGANIGLVTRQLLHRLPSIHSAVCFEPNPENYRLLRQNLRHLPQCRLIQAALGSEDGVLDFYEDTTNFGNYSMVENAMKGTSFRTSKVKCMTATAENVLGGFSQDTIGYPIIWKSDTQGFDETIVTTLPDSFWERVHAGVMEIWRIEKPTVNYPRLAAILGRFPNRYFSTAPNRRLSTDEIIQYSQGTDCSHEDLCFVR